MNTQWIALLPSSKQPFRRAIRDADGEIQRVLRFEPDTPIEVDEEGCEVVLADIGRVLCLVEPDGPGDPPTRFTVDWEGTNAIHKKFHGTVVPRQSASIQSGAGAKEPLVSEKNEGDGDSDEDDDEVVLDDDLVDLLEKHGESLPDPITPESLGKWIEEGNQLTTLDGFTIDSATRLHVALGLEPPAETPDPVSDDPAKTVVDATDLSKLLAANLSEDLAKALAKNAPEHPWVMDPEQIKVKIAEGFDLTTLTEIGNGRAKNIRAALGIADQA